MTNVGALWLRERMQDFRDRAEQAEDESTKMRLLARLPSLSGQLAR